MSAHSPSLGIALYTVTLALESVVGVLRCLLVGLVLSVPAELLGGPADLLAAVVALAIGFGPVLLSLAAACGVPGGALERYALGARRPSQRERDTVTDALHLLGPDITAPRRWFVIDSPDLNAMVLGNVLYLHRALIADDALPAVLAHELGHLHNLDGRLTLALNRFALTPFRPRGGRPRWRDLQLLRPLWLAWWRHREYAADAYAARLGQAQQLAAALERTQLLDTAVPYMHDRTHPYHEHRIDRLGRATDAHDPHHA